MNVWGRSLRLHIPLKDIFLMHYLAPILNNPKIRNYHPIHD